jgi:MoxR-like ATPase
MSPSDPDRPDDLLFSKDLLAWLSKAEPVLRDRVLAAADARIAHRRELEMAALQADIADTRRGQYCGLIHDPGDVVYSVLGRTPDPVEDRP